MTQQVYQLDWFATNETVKYPIDSQASFVPIGYDSVPAGLMGVITDISFAIPSTLEGTPYLSALTITDDLISLIICIDDRPIFAFSSTQRSLYSGRYYNLTSFCLGCSGVIVFGEAAKSLRCAYRFTSQDAAFLPTVYNRYTVFPVTSISRVGNATTCTGDILFKGSGDIKVETSSINVDGERSKAIFIKLNTEINPDVLSKYLGPCDGRPESETCRRISVEAINGATPVNGNIVFIGKGIYINTTEGGMTLSTDYKLEDICLQDKMVQLIAENKCLIKKDEEQEESIETDPESSEEETSDCDSSPLKINFSKDVYGSGIEISNKGITPLSGAVHLSIPLLEAKRYVGLRVTRPSESGYFKLVTEFEEVIIESLGVRINGQKYLFEENQRGLPARVAIQIDYCNSRIRVIANKDVFTREVSRDLIRSVKPELKDCYLEYVEYK